MARPKAKIEKKDVSKLAEMGLSQEQIADFFSVNVTTIFRRFAKEIKEGKAKMVLSLKRQLLLRAL